MWWLAGFGAIGAVGLGLAGWTASVARKVEGLVPVDGSFADVPGARLHYVELGPADAPPLVMIHGILSQLRVFSYALLAPLARDHRVILVDRPGWGYSTATAARLGIAGQAEAIAALLDALKVEQPVLVGHSLGGAVSLALAEAHPGRVRGLALIAPYTQPIDRPPEPFRSLMVPAPLRKLVAWTVALPIALRTAQAKTREVFAPDAVPADFAVKAGGVLTIRPAAHQSASFELAVARPEMAQIAARYGELALPVAILYGRGDNLLDPALHGGRTAEAIAGARLTLIDGGHMLPISHAAETEAWLRAAIAAMPAWSNRPSTPTPP